jgi:hypothetical protein
MGELAKPEVESTGRAEDGTLYCVSCGTAITHQAARCDINGAHLHTCTNPLGVIYRIGCFANVRNVTASGEPTEAHTWFAGRAWEVVACNGCGGHLGWRFSGSGAAFFGLIMGALTESG